MSIPETPTATKECPADVRVFPEELPRTFAQALHVEVATLQAKHPAIADAIGRAHALLLEGRLFPEDDGRTAMVRASEGQGWYRVNGTCTCAAAAYHTEVPCKHRFALKLYQRVSALVCPAPTEDERSCGAPPITAAAPRLKPEWLEMINGTSFIKYVGLLHLAHAAGLLSLSADWTCNADGLSLARAIAVFRDGRQFVENGDSTPESGKRVGLHWRRLALTRAKSRALRDALGIDMCSVDEIE
jgi:hypothetical protein